MKTSSLLLCAALALVSTNAFSKDVYFATLQTDHMGVFGRDDQIVTAVIDDATNTFTGFKFTSVSDSKKVRQASLAQLRAGVPILGGLAKLTASTYSFDPARGGTLSLSWKNTKGAATSEDLHLEPLDGQWISYGINPMWGEISKRDGNDLFYGLAYVLDNVELTRESLPLRQILFTRKVGGIEYTERMSPGSAWVFNAGSGKRVVDAASDWEQVDGARYKILDAHQTEVLHRAGVPANEAEARPIKAAN